VPEGEGREYNTLEQVFIPASKLYTATEVKTVSGNGEARINEDGEVIALKEGEYQARLHLNDPACTWILPSNDDVQTEDPSERVSDGDRPKLTTKQDQTVSFTVYPLNIRYANVSGITNQKYTGAQVLQTPVLSLPVLGPEAVLVEGRDYTYTIENNVNVGKAVIRIQGIGDCGGESSRTFKINPKGTKITKLRKGKKSIVVKWKRQSAKMRTSRITGYQIQVATNKKFTKNKKTVTVKGWKKTSGKVGKLKAGKKYYVRVRTFSKADGVKCYSAWSKVRSCKTGK
jgi:hypothetical protein